jgi:hypothetical protein
MKCKQSCSYCLFGFCCCVGHLFNIQEGGGDRRDADNAGLVVAYGWTNHAGGAGGAGAVHSVEEVGAVHNAEGFGGLLGHHGEEEVAILLGLSADHSPMALLLVLLPVLLQVVPLHLLWVLVLLLMVAALDSAAAADVGAGAGGGRRGIESDAGAHLGAAGDGGGSGYHKSPAAAAAAAADTDDDGDESKLQRSASNCSCCARVCGTQLLLEFLLVPPLLLPCYCS